MYPEATTPGGSTRSLPAAEWCLIKNWEGYGLALEDAGKFLRLAWLRCLQCRQLKSIFGGSKSPCLFSTWTVWRGTLLLALLWGPLPSLKSHARTHQGTCLWSSSPDQLESGEQHQWTSFQPQVCAGDQLWCCVSVSDHSTIPSPSTPCCFSLLFLPSFTLPLPGEMELTVGEEVINVNGVAK